jgi:Domain of unknown function (DUF4907)
MNVKSKYLILFILILSGSLIGFIVLKTNFSSRPEVYKTSVYKINDGYGYSISYHNKLIIKQDIIPGIQTNQSFCNANDAQKVANLVKEKLNNNESPNISLQELKSLEIQLKCSNG